MLQKNSNQITIIGTGLAGYNLAKEIRKLDGDIKITMITFDGGEFYYKPHLSNALTKFDDSSALILATAEQMSAQYNLHILTHTRVEHIDTEQKTLALSDGETITYSKLVLATGASPIKAILNTHSDDCITSVNNLDDYFAFRDHIKNKSSITVLGAGLVGCEFADDLANAGFKVDVIAPSFTPVDTLTPPKVGKALQDALTAKGVTWHLGLTATEISKDNDQYAIMLSNDTLILTDHILSAIGIQPNIALAQKSGLDTNKGIVVDEYLETNIKDIFAIGDCAEVHGQVLPYIMPLQQCVKSLAKVLLDEQTPVHYPHMPVIVKTQSLPIVALPSPPNTEGNWEFEHDAHHITALLYDHDTLKGFVLTGDKVKERMKWIKAM